MSEAYIIDAVRTPRGIGKVGKGAFAHMHPQHLAATVLKAIAERNQLNTADVDDVIWSTSTQKGKQGGDMGRMAALDAGYDPKASGMTLDRFCGGGITAVSIAAAQIMAGMEDLVVAGKKSRACPYFAAKHAAEGAELVFCPYNYLLDPAVRSAMDIDVKGAIVILDEAHNVEDTSREAASCDIDLEHLEEAAAAFAGVASNSRGDGEAPSDEADATLIRELLHVMHRTLDNALKPSRCLCFSSITANY